jgi:D-3-phosphoglycerate dehydrogenase
LTPIFSVSIMKVLHRKRRQRRTFRCKYSDRLRSARRVFPMYHIKTMNKISAVGLNKFDREKYLVSDTETNEDGILVRSAKLHDYVFPRNLLAIARAGSGVNNIPLDRCSENGIVVFNTPGANANAVKELVICAMLMASRDIEGSTRWVREQVASGIDVTTVVEKGKSAFVGPELYKKTLGVIGLGAIGALVANIALSLGMDVYGYDPFLSVESALRLDRHIHVVKDVNELYRKSDYITPHLHVTDATRGLIGAAAIANMKRGVRVLNFARGEIVDDDAMLAALETGKVACYVTDFPNNKIMAGRHVVAFPHLGASTPESEQNCAVMAANELTDYLEYGNIRNSVNLPAVSQEPSGVMRLCLIHRNIPAMLANITAMLSKDGINVENMSNKSKGDYAYTIVDLGTTVDRTIIEDVKALNGVIRVRALNWD